MPALTHVRAALGQRNFRLYISGNSISLLGMWTQRIAVGWLAWELTHSGAWLGAVAFADLFPSILIGPFAGVIADRFNRLRIIFVAQALSMLQAIVLAVLTVAGWITIEVLLALVLLNGVVIGFNQPARLSLVPALVPRANLSTAIAINSIVFNLARFVGPALSGTLILLAGAGAAFAVNAASYIAFLVVLARLRLAPEALEVHGAARASMLADLAAGVRYALGHAGIAPLLLLATATGAGVRFYVELFPGFAAAVFDRGAGGLAALASAVGIGAVAGGLWLAQRGSSDGLARIALAGSGLATLSVLLFTASPWFALALACAGVSGVFMVVSGVAMQTAVQLAVDPAVRGRVLGLYGLIMRSSPAAGALVLGSASEIVGLRAAVALGGCGTIVAWLWVWRRRADVARALAAPSP